MSEQIPGTRRARHERITAILNRTVIRSQHELAQQLAADGIEVSQGTLSRDLDELGAVRVRTTNGSLVYAVPGEGGDPTPRVAAHDESSVSNVVDARLVRVCEEILVSATHSANLVVLRTPPGAAQYLASAVDHTAQEAILGTIAGDDTVLIVTAQPTGGQRVADWFLALADGRVPETPPTTPTDRST